MKPNYALNLSPEGIGLLHRKGSTWHSVGAVALDDPELGDKLDVLRKTAANLEPSGIATKLVIPNDQILYRLVEVDGTTEADQTAAVIAEMEGATPYELDQLAIDWHVLDNGNVAVAAVARRTLEEAEAFSVENRFNAVSFVAVAPEDSGFPTEPFFGETRDAAKLLAPGTRVERDPDPIPLAALAISFLHDDNEADDAGDILVLGDREALEEETASAESELEEPVSHIDKADGDEEEISEPEDQGAPEPEFGTEDADPVLHVAGAAGSIPSAPEDTGLDTLVSALGVDPEPVEDIEETADAEAEDSEGTVTFLRSSDHDGPTDESEVEDQEASDGPEVSDEATDPEETATEETPSDEDPTEGSVASAGEQDSGEVGQTEEPDEATSVSDADPSVAPDDQSETDTDAGNPDELETVKEGTEDAVPDEEPDAFETESELTQTDSEVFGATSDDDEELSPSEDEAVAPLPTDEPSDIEASDERSEDEAGPLSDDDGLEWDPAAAARVNEAEPSQPIVTPLPDAPEPFAVAAVRNPGINSRAQIVLAVILILFALLLWASVFMRESITAMFGTNEPIEIADVSPQSPGGTAITDEPRDAESGVDIIASLESTDTSTTPAAAPVLSDIFTEAPATIIEAPETEPFIALLAPADDPSTRTTTWTLASLGGFASPLPALPGAYPQTEVVKNPRATDVDDNAPLLPTTSDELAVTLLANSTAVAMAALPMPPWSVDPAVLAALPEIDGRRLRSGAEAVVVRRGTDADAADEFVAKRLLGNNSELIPQTDLTTTPTYSRPQASDFAVLLGQAPKVEDASVVSVGGVAPDASHNATPPKLELASLDPAIAMPPLDQLSTAQEPQDGIGATMEPIAPPLAPEALREELAAFGQNLKSIAPRLRPDAPDVPTEAIAAAVATAVEEPEEVVEEPETESTIALLRPALRPTNVGQRNAASASPQPQVSIPSSASVARRATEENALRLNRINLIGVFGKSADRRALVRLSSGRIVRVGAGDRLNGGRVVSITSDQLIYSKNGRNETLTLPRG